MSGAEKRRAAHLSGVRAETMAEVWLRLKFYRILARRYRVHGGEVDIIAKRGKTMAFVEVKARGDIETALTAITPQKQRRFSIAAAHWLATNPWAANGYVLRADAVFIAPGKFPKHLEAAFEMRMG